MASAHQALVGFLFVVVVLASICGVASKSFTISNNCEYTLWPGILSSAGSAGMDTTGFVLAPGESRAMPVPSGWSGRLWGRTLCSTDASTGKFSCVTGDCGSGKPDCAGGGATPPATLAEFTMDGSGGMDFYDVSLVDGYNLPVLVAPRGAAAGGNCAPTGCMVDLRIASTSTAAGGVACKSACEAFRSPKYCCSGEHGNPSTCRPSAYSQFFKNACPQAYSYAYDDATSTFTCAGGDTAYAITFCPSTSRLTTTTASLTAVFLSCGFLCTCSVKAADASPQAPGPLPLMNDTMVYLGADQLGAAARPLSSIHHAVLAVGTLVLAGALY
ncbi:thaumatin-like protein 1b [Panicum miliaceum]|uniref:Thaumatin-like protein 1b n=1 Tax=Panicum miliaceum TaxID=4540 RepID=A0A3L6QMJ5_PANMI|nr:thaumatin-like protein 1b [Panicum miliaceum]